MINDPYAFCLLEIDAICRFSQHRAHGSAQLPAQRSLHPDHAYLPSPTHEKRLCHGLYLARYGFEKPLKARDLHAVFDSTCTQVQQGEKMPSLCSSWDSNPTPLTHQSIHQYPPTCILKSIRRNWGISALPLPLSMMSVRVCHFARSKICKLLLQPCAVTNVTC